MTLDQSIQLGTTAATCFVSVLSVGWLLFRMMLGRLDESEARIYARLDAMNIRIGSVDTHLADLNGKVAEHEKELRRGEGKFTSLVSSMADVRRVLYAQLDDLNIRRAEAGLPPIALD